MKHCKYCHIEVDTNNDFCPLCFNHLSETDSSFDQLYSKRFTNETTDRKKLFISKLFLFLTICVITACFFINYLVNFEVKWFLVVTFGILYVWVLVAHTIMTKRSAFKKILLQIISIIALLYFTERVSEPQDWLLPYVYPSISFTAVFALLMILFIDKNRSRKVLGFSVLILLMLVGSIVIMIFNIAQFKLLNFLNCVICGLTLVGLFVFASNSIKHELSKRFHL